MSNRFTYYIIVIPHPEDSLHYFDDEGKFVAGCGNAKRFDDYAMAKYKAKRLGVNAHVLTQT